MIIFFIKNFYLFYESKKTVSLFFKDLLFCSLILIMAVGIVNSPNISCTAKLYLIKLLGSLVEAIEKENNILLESFDNVAQFIE